MFYVRTDEPEFPSFLMKTISIAIVAETGPVTQSEELKAEEAAARETGDPTKIGNVGAKVAAANREGEAAQAASGVDAAREAVAKLEAAGLVVKSAVVSAAPRAGFHEAVTTTDLLAPEPEPAPEPAAEPVNA